MTPYTFDTAIIYTIDIRAFKRQRMFFKLRHGIARAIRLGSILLVAAVTGKDAIA